MATPLTGERALERVGAAVFAAYALAQLFQEFVLAHAPSDSAPMAVRLAFATSALDRSRAIALYVAFLGLPFGYAAVYRRLRARGWAVAALWLIALFVGLELVDRAVGLVAVADWQRRWLAAGANEALRASLSARLEVVDDLETALYLPLLTAHALGALAFALALLPLRDRWSRVALAGFALNFVRATVRIGAMQLGLHRLTPLADALYLPLTLAHALAVALWLARPPAPPRE
jgi:hypothetical protein